MRTFAACLMGSLDPVNCLNGDVQQRPMLVGVKRVTVNQQEGEKIIKDLSNSKVDESGLKERGIKDASNENAEKLRQHDATLQRWNDNVETAKAMCEERLDKNVNNQLKSAIERKPGKDKSIIFNSGKNLFFYNNNGKTAKFKVIQGSNGKHLLQITIAGRLSNDELEPRIEEIVNALSEYGTIERHKLTEEQTSEKRTLRLPNGTEIILPSDMNGKLRTNFKVEHNKIRFQGDSYKNDMASVFGKDNIPVNVNEGFSVNEMSNDVWRNDCMRNVKSMIFPMVELNEQYGKFLDGKKIKAPVNCLFELLSMNMMLNSMLGHQNKQSEEILKIAGSLSLAIKQDTGAVSISGFASKEIIEDPFESWKTTLESIHAAYDKFIQRIAHLKNSTTFIAEEAVLRQHEALLRKLFIEATNRANDVLEVDKNEIANTISPLRSEMDFFSASGIMSNVFKMFDEQHNKKQKALELKKKEQERKEKEEQSQQEINDLREDVRRLTAEVAERDNQKKELIQQIDTKIDTKKEESKKDIEGLKDQIGELTQNIQDLKAQIEDLQKKSVQPMAGGDSDATMFNTVNSIRGSGYMQPINDGMKQEIEGLKQFCEKQRQEIERLKAKLDSMQVDHEELEKLRYERDEWKRKYDEQSAKLSELADKGSVTTQRLEQKVNESQDRLNQFEPGHREVDESYLSEPEPLSFE